MPGVGANAYQVAHTVIRTVAWAARPKHQSESYIGTVVELLCMVAEPAPKVVMSGRMGAAILVEDGRGCVPLLLFCQWGKW